MSEEQKTVETTEICTCNNVFHQAEPDDYDTLGSDSGVCCPDCGNEEFQTVADLQSQLNEAEFENARLQDIIAQARKVAQKKVYRTPDKMLLRNLLKE